MNKYDVAVIGMGVAGTFSCLKIAKEYKDLKVIAFDIGRPWGKRRQQVVGAFGCLPNSDGKLYINDKNKIIDVAGNRKTKSANKWFNEYISNCFDLKTIKDKSPGINLSKKIKKSGFSISLNDHMQLYPKEIHALSKYTSNILYDAKNINMIFDAEVLDIRKEKKSFIINYDGLEVECKKVIMCSGRAGWRWTKKVYDDFGLVKNNDVAKFGVRIEAPSYMMKDFNKSNCSLKKDNLELGPLCWNGTVIPEDHVDLVISAFRSNENRWDSDKVSFNLIGDISFKGEGMEQTNRIGQLTFILSNDRVMKEKVSSILNKKSKISILPEYNWLIDVISDLKQFMPDVISKGYFHVPTIMPLIPKISVGNDLSTDLDGLYCAGEAAGIVGILSAALTGLIAADGACA